MRDVRFGQFRHSVEIKEPGQQRTPSGDFEPGEPVTFCNRFAAIRGLSGQEAVRARAVEAETTHLIQIRTDSQVAQVTPRMQIHFDDKLSGRVRVFEILSKIDLEELGRVTEFTCKERVS